jgi:hypothetical protein
MDPYHPANDAGPNLQNPFKGPLSPHTPPNSPPHLLSNAPSPPLILPNTPHPLLLALNLFLQLPQPHTCPHPVIPIFRSRCYHRMARPCLAMLWYIVPGIPISVADFVGDARGQRVSVCFCLIAQHVLIAEVWGGYLDRGRTDTFSLVIYCSEDFFPSYTDCVYVPV